MTADDLPDPATAGLVGTPAPPAELLVVGRFDARPGYLVHREQGAPSWIVTWTVGGAGHFRQGDVDIIARPGDLVVLGPELAHGYAVEAGARHWSFWWVHCPARSQWHAWLGAYEIGDRVFQVPSVPEAVHARVEAAFRRLHADARWSGHGAPPAPAGSTHNVAIAVAAGTAARELALGRVEEVLVLATAAAGVAQGQLAQSSGLDPRVRRVEALLSADPSAPHTVRSLADHVALSPSRLAHLFAAQTGSTPMQALRDARLRHAARLLEATDLPVGSVAAASGFVSAFHFSRVFRARYGVPPGAYRSAAE